MNYYIFIISILIFIANYTEFRKSYLSQLYFSIIQNSIIQIS